MLADWDKDGGAVSMFPEIAEEWLTQVQAQSGWQNFQPADFRRLRTRYGVKWVVSKQPAGVFSLPLSKPNGEGLQGGMTEPQDRETTPAPHWVMVGSQ